MGTRLTLEQIGELAGVSRATVSRVVNNHPNVRDEVRERVLQVIQETGYQPNMAARSLASNRTGVLGLIIPRIVQSLFTDPYFPRLIQGVSQACNLSDYTLSLFLFHTEDEEHKLYPRVMHQGHLDGVIIASSQIDDPLIPQLLKNDMPFLVIGQPLEFPDASFVDVDNVTGAYTAVTHLLRQGHRRIATITGRQDMAAGIDRRQGYVNALQSRGIHVDESLIVTGNFSESEAYDAMRLLLPYKPDAVFVASDGMALGALRALLDSNLRVPTDIALVGFDDLPAATQRHPSLTTIRQPIRRIGALAVDTLIDIINNPTEPPRRIVLPTELVIRESCGFQ